MQPTTPQRGPQPTPADSHAAAPFNQGAAPATTEDFKSQYDGYDLTVPGTEGPVEPDSVHENGTHSRGGEVVWQASEYVHHEKEIGWFIIAGIATAALAGIAAFFRQWTFAVLIVVMGAALIVFGRRPPRILHYAVGMEGISVDQKDYTYDEFRSFGILQDGPLFSILLFPRKRFMPAVTMYFSEADGERIVDILGAHLPSEPVQLEFIDKLTRKLRF